MTYPSKKKNENSKAHSKEWARAWRHARKEARAPRRSKRKRGLNGALEKKQRLKGALEKRKRGLKGARRGNEGSKGIFKRNIYYLKIYLNDFFKRNTISKQMKALEESVSKIHFIKGRFRSDLQSLMDSISFDSLLEWVVKHAPTRLIKWCCIILRAII